MGDDDWNEATFAKEQQARRERFCEMLRHTLRLPYDRVMTTGPAIDVLFSGEPHKALAVIESAYSYRHAAAHARMLKIEFDACLKRWGHAIEKARRAT